MHTGFGDINKLVIGSKWKIVGGKKTYVLTSVNYQSETFRFYNLDNPIELTSWVSALATHVIELPSDSCIKLKLVGMQLGQLRNMRTLEIEVFNSIG